MLVASSVSSSSSRTATIRVSVSTRLVLAWSQSVRTGRPPSVGSVDGRATLAVVLGMYESARAGRPVVLDERG